MVKVDIREYSERVEAAAKQGTMAEIKAIVKTQSHIVFTPDDFLRPISSRNNKAILRLVTEIAPLSPTINDLMLNDVEAWIGRFGFVEDEEEFDLFVLLLRQMITHKALPP